ncbi:hypothetical protein ANAPC3_01384 [Anaplasma phagocytophilum]|nr:hypothetical protein ANAPC3_01384 [Anaplasma phagocytophilum]
MASNFMLGKIIKPLYGPAQYGESLIVVCFVSGAVPILPSSLLRDGVVCYMSTNHAHEVTTKTNTSVRNNE